MALGWLKRVLNRLPCLKRGVKKFLCMAGAAISDRKTIPTSIVQVTSSRSEHLFGYYDKCPWNKDDTKMLYLRVTGADKMNASDNPADIIIHDMARETETIVGQTAAWNVQQGCMLQWRGPNFDTEILYNTFDGKHYITIVQDVVSGDRRVVDSPVYSVASDGVNALTLDFSRLNTFRPGYGYINAPDETANTRCPDQYCIWHVNLQTDETKGILKYTELLAFEHKSSMDQAYHKVNHIMINPECTRFMFLHRWIVDGKKYDRLLTCDLDGTGLHNLLDEDMVSHSYWLDEERIITYANTYADGRQYYILKDKCRERTIAMNGLLKEDGHPSLSPNGKFIVTDTYPNFRRKQTIYVYDVEHARVSKAAEIYANPRYSEECRCDLHPRWNHSSSAICFDGAQKKKRQVYVIGTEEICNG